MARRHPVWILLLAILCAGCAAAPSSPGVAGEAADGGEYARRVEHQGVEFDTLRVPLDRFEVRLFWRDAADQPLLTLQRLLTELQQAGDPPLMLTNAGIFQPGFIPLGLHVEQGRELVALNRWHGGGNFFMEPNGVLAITREGAHILRTSRYREIEGEVVTATQSGPLLLEQGRLHPSFREGSASRYLRSGVGICGANELLFAISRRPVNLHDFATLFRDALGCTDALYLDGSISEMYLPALGRTWTWRQFAGMIGVFARE